MLNKLLKRCMPWMDKGRWYQIRVSGTSIEDVNIVSDPVFSAVDLGTAGGMPAVNFSIPANRFIIDYKFIPTPGFLSVIPQQVYLEKVTDDLIAVTNPCPGTYWFFMR